MFQWFNLIKQDEIELRIRFSLLKNVFIFIWIVYVII